MAIIEKYLVKLNGFSSVREYSTFDDFVVSLRNLVNDKETLEFSVWTVKKDIIGNTIKERCLDFLRKQKGKSFTINEVVDELGCKYHGVKRVLRELKNSGIILRKRGIPYRYTLV